jgi:hypothetical protein
MKRFTETTKWSDPWFVRLSARHKLLWLYICDYCDASGVIDFCPEIASIQIGTEVSENDFDKLGDRVLKLPSGKWLIRKFLAFQYVTVDPKCPAHKPILKLIEENGLNRLSNTLSNRVLDNLKEKEKDKEKDKRGECERGENGEQPKMTKYGLPLPPRCTIRQSDGAVLDYTGRVMDINQVRNSAIKSS